MQNIPVSTHPRLTHAQKSILAKCKITDVQSVLLTSPLDLSKRCRISPVEAQEIHNALLKQEIAFITPLEDLPDLDECMMTTGDSLIDSALGGGIRTGMIWEVAGESSAGKSQFAMQLSLMVQLPPELGGLLGSACYMPTSLKLQTHRILEIRDHHPVISGSYCTLDDIHTLSIPSIPAFITILSETLPTFLKQKLASSRPVRLIIIDALGELFNTEDRTTTKTLVERSQSITQVSSLLHAVASRWNIAVLVINEVVDAFDNGQATNSGEDLEYKTQAQWFNRAHSLTGEDRKEAKLGLVWANQVNARLLFSRTNRRRHIDLEQDQNKRQKLSVDGDFSTSDVKEDCQTSTIRRMSVVFNSVAPPASLDYMVSSAGISALTTEDSVSQPFTQMHPIITPAANFPLATDIAPLDVGFAEDGHNSVEVPSSQPDQDEDLWVQFPALDDVNEVEGA